MTTEFDIKDSGDRRGFDTGATRDVDYDKPRFDLIPTTVIKTIINTKTYPFTRLDEFGVSDNIKAQLWNLGMGWGDDPSNNNLIHIIQIVLDVIMQQEKDAPLMHNDDSDNSFHIISPKTYYRLANHYGGGAKKYDPWNWAKGMPLSVFHASLMRHIFSIIENETDEDHLSAIFFNAASILHFNLIHRDDLDDVTPRVKGWYNEA